MCARARSFASTLWIMCLIDNAIMDKSARRVNSASATISRSLVRDLLVGFQTACLKPDTKKSIVSWYGGVIPVGRGLGGGYNPKYVYIYWDLTIQHVCTILKSFPSNKFDRFWGVILGNLPLKTVPGKGVKKWQFWQKTWKSALFLHDFSLNYIGGKKVRFWGVFWGRNWVFR